MRLLTTGLLLASLCTLASPREVEAQDGKRWWGWLERLSGPGPFQVDPSPTMLLEFDRLICGNDEGEIGSAYSIGHLRNPIATRAELCGVRDTPRWFLSFHVSPVTNEDIESQPADWGATTLTRSFFVAYVRPLPTPMLHLGAGAGVYHFNGVGNGALPDDYTNYEAVIPVRVRLTPFAILSPDNVLLGNLSRSFYWEGGWDFVPGPIDAAEFKSSTTYRKQNEWGWTHRFVLNVASLIGF